MNAPTTRRTYLDVMRGVATLIMIEAHVIDSWTRPAEHQSHWFRQSMVLGGFAAPLFLFFAGVAVALSAGSKSRRLGDEAAAVRAVRKRGLQLFLLAFLFRFQSMILSQGPAWTLLKVDILNIMGLSIVAAVTLWGLTHSARSRAAVCAAAAAALVLFAPAIRAIAALAALPDWLEAYLRPIPGLTNFSLFPWAGFLMAGAAVGVVLDSARSAGADRRANLAFLGGGLLVAFVAWRASSLPPLDPRSTFWQTSLSFFLIRLGLMTASIGAAWLWEQRRAAGKRWSPLQLLGRRSLFVYWIHVEMVYGVMSDPLHGAFTLAGAWQALFLFSTLMVGAAAAWEWASGKYQRPKDFRANLSRLAQPLMFKRRHNINSSDGRLFD